MADQYNEKIIEPGDRLSQLAYHVNVESYKNCPALEVVPDPEGDWRGDVGTIWKPHILDLMKKRHVAKDGRLHPVMWETHSTDGGGHRPSILAADGSVEAFESIGLAPIDMNDHDIIRRGGKPCIMTCYNDIQKITQENIHLGEAYLNGYGKGLKRAGLVSVTGETAVMPYGVTAFCDLKSDSQMLMNVAGNCTGLHHIKKYISGRDTREGMPIVGVWEQGMRWNGATYYIDLIREVWGPEPEKILANPEARKFMQMLSVPSVSCTKTFLRVHGWDEDGSIIDPLASIVGAYHITGGGIWNKLKLPPGIGAVLDSMWPPQGVLLWAQELSWYIPSLKLTDWKAYRTTHGGPAMLFVCETEKDVEILIAEAQHDKLYACRVGKTIASLEGEIIIHSQFRQKRVLSSLRPELE